MKIIHLFFMSIVGVIFFVSAITLWSKFENANTEYLNATKQDYVKNEVYSESSLKNTDESIISKSELIAILTNGPTESMTIRDANCVMKVKASRGANNYVTVRLSDPTLPEHEKTKSYYMGKNRWDATKLDLSSWITSDKFYVKPIINNSGGVDNILYYGRQIQ